MPTMDSDHETIVRILKDANAIVGNSEHLTTADVAEKLDIDQSEAESLLSELKWDHEIVLKGPDIGADGDQWRLDDKV